MRLKYIILFFSVLIGSLLSCGKDSACFKGTGKIIKEQRTISSAVTSINTADNIDIVITQSNTPSLTVEAGDNLISYINTDISGDILSISSDNKCSMFRDNSIPITVYISIPNLTRIDYTGQGNITNTNTLNLTNFDIESRGGTGSINLSMNVTDLAIRQHSGPADFTLAGVANKTYIYTLGVGWFYLNGLTSNEVHVNNSGIGDVSVRANNLLLVELQSSGNIDYYGNPTVTVTNHSGSGQLRKK